MKNQSICCVAAALAIGLLPAVSRAGQERAKEQIQACYDRLSAAFRNQDAHGIDALVAPGATLKTPDGKIWTREKIVTDMAKQSRMMKDSSWQRTVTSTRAHGNEATATVTGKFHGQFTGKDGKPHTFDLDSLSVDTWVRMGPDWKLKHADTKKLVPHMDGKAMPDGAGRHG